MDLVRRALLTASQSLWLRERATRYGFMRRTVKRFMPGEQVEDALGAAVRLAESHIGAVFTHLGENITARAEAEAVTQHYLGVLERLAASRMDAEISVKLTQLGLDIDQEFCYQNVQRLLERTPAEKTLWIDMEQSPYVDSTLELHARARRAYANAGVCVQAYLYRTAQDVAKLTSAGAAVRLVKGAYNEPAQIAFPKKQDVDQNFFELAQTLLSESARRADVRAAMATHDRALIQRITAWAATQGLANPQLEFQMLYGIQRAEQLRLAANGYRMIVLIAYGSYWFPWFMRRLAERPANLFFLARNLFS